MLYFFDEETVFLRNFAQKNAVYALETCKSILAAAVVLKAGDPFDEMLAAIFSLSFRDTGRQKSARNDGGN